MHIIINKILIDGNYYSNFTTDMDASQICLETKIIAFPDHSAFEFDKVLQEYQIKISSYLDEQYIKNFFGPSRLGIAQMACKIQNGENGNEVKLVPKNIKKEGFFEKFFQLFS